MDLDELLRKTIDCIRGAVEEDKIIGKPISTMDGNVILPVSKLSYGFVTGGGEYGTPRASYPYAGVTGGGVTVSPLGFLICGREKRFVAVDGDSPSKWTDLLRAAIHTFKKD